MKPLILLITSTLVIMADFTIAPVLPKIKEAFADTEKIDQLVQMVLTIPALFIMLSSPITGYLTDKYGRKPVIIPCLILYIIAGVSGYFATSIYELLISRAIFGIAVSGVITVCSALITDYYKESELSRMMGLQSSFIGYSGLIYMILGGIFADFSWRNAFLVYLFPIILLILFAIYIDEPDRKRKIHLNTQIVNFKKYLKIYLGGFLLMIFFYMIPLHVPFYLKSIMPDITNTNIAFTLAIFSFCSATTSIFYKNIKNRLSFKNLFIIPFVTMSLGYIIISLSSEYLFSVIGLIIAGIGMGLIVPNLRVWVGSLSDVSFSGRAFGGLTTCFYLGQIFSPILIYAIAGNFTIAGFIMLIMSVILLYTKLQSKTKLQSIE